MKRIVLIVVGAILAIAMIPIIVTSINRMTQSKEYERQVDLTVHTDSSIDITKQDQSFIIDYYDFFVSYTLSPEIVSGTSTYGQVVIDSVTVLKGSFGAPGSTATVIRLSFDNQSSTTIKLEENGIIVDNPVISSFVPDNDFTISLLFEVTQPAQVTGVGAALLGLVPILFVLGTVFSAIIFTKEWY